jgi:hypothetical protein
VGWLLFWNGRYPIITRYISVNHEKTKQGQTNEKTIINQRRSGCGVNVGLVMCGMVEQESVFE